MRLHPGIATLLTGAIVGHALAFLDRYVKDAPRGPALREAPGVSTFEHDPGASTE